MSKPPTLLLPVCFASAILVLGSTQSYAAGEPPNEAETADPNSATTSPASEGEAVAADAKPPADVVPSDERPFIIRRGLFVEADLGVFFSLNGYAPRTAGAGASNKKFLSSIQPHLGAVVGHHVLSGPKYALSAGLRLGVGYSGGLARVDGVDVNADFQMMTVGVEVAYARNVSDRVALVLKLDGGLGIVGPHPTLSAPEVGSASAAMGGSVGVGLGVEYFTLLNDFTVGIDLHPGMIFSGGATIPTVSITAPVKYTF